MNTILERHYHATRVNLDAPDMLPMPGDQAASNCAALHVGIDAMARIAARRTPKHAEPINPEWIGTVNVGAGFDAKRRRSVTTQMVAILTRHSQRVHDARTFVGDTNVSLQATTVAMVSVLR